MSAWLETLRQECERRSQSAVARELGISHTTISLVLNGKWTKSTVELQRRVEAAFNPPWLVALRKACDESSQAAVARLFGYSPAVINQVLKGTYKGDVKRVQRLAESHYFGTTVDCPWYRGAIPVHQCLAAQKRTAAEVRNHPLDRELWYVCHHRCSKSEVRLTHHLSDLG